MSNAFRDPSFGHEQGKGDYPQSGGSFLRADRSPCPVCGHPTGDCSSTDSNKVNIAFGDANTRMESMKEIQKILVEDDIFEERQITPYTKISVRIAKKGSYVTIDRAIELGIIKK